ncbi:hypothetical protein GCM10025762_02470 [Haloechinothrix salitolerans]
MRGGEVVEHAVGDVAFAAKRIERALVEDRRSRVGGHRERGAGTAHGEHRQAVCMGIVASFGSQRYAHSVLR